jgi:2-pyrone-4,6-dicarboxylate lactonase
MAVTSDMTTGIWDTHVHAFGPVERYPVQADRGYDPPAARPAAYQAEARAARLGPCVFVQPSIYAADNTALLDALATGEGRDRGIVAPSEGWTRQHLVFLHERGVRGLRLNLLSPGGNGPALIRQLTPTLRDLGWHVAALLDATRPDLLEAVLADLDLPLVLDHFGRPPQGVLDPHLAVFEPLLRAVAERRVWVKLSAADQISRQPPPWDDVAPLAMALLTAGADRLLFGSNWPHVGASDMPRLTTLTDIVAGWIRAAKVEPGLIFNENPAGLYA